MKWLRDLRKHLHCNQEDLAVYLCISRSQLAMAEKNSRDLPSSSHLQALHVYSDMTLLDKECHGQSPSPEQTAAEAAGAEKKREQLRRKAKADLHKLNIKLDRITEAYTLARRMQTILPQLLQKTATQNPNLLPLLQQTERKIQESLKANSVAVQETLRIQIHSLEAILTYTPPPAATPDSETHETRMALARHEIARKRMKRRREKMK
ncbi:MAG: helix-turn-helix domain-containing protein [Cyclobacteriaceae bacterium]